MGWTVLNFEEFLKKCIRALNNSGVEYVIASGVLVSIYGEPRAIINNQNQ